MRKFEYDANYNMSIEQMNELGNEGWELVHVQRDFKTGRHWFYFKREIL
jgi:hypothetical protein